MSNKPLYKIVIVGGGAGGLELAVRLAKKYHLKKKLSITLVDESLKYIWKPLYHEVAVGTVDYAQNELNYITYAHKKGFNFVLGSFFRLDKEKKEIVIAPVLDDNQKVVIKERILAYDLLVIAVGSTSNSFQIPGVKENCFFLDKLAQAERFQRDFLYKIIGFIQTNGNSEKKTKVVIVGGGATGVELAAELKYALSQAISYGSKSPAILKNLEISIIESADRILPNLSPYISKKVKDILIKKGISVLTGQRVTKATPLGVETNSNLFIESDVTVWSAGIKGNDFLANLDLECNNNNQLLVKSNLQSVSDNAVFALGDCAACPFGDKNGFVPPRAQAARQQAILLTKSIKRFLSGKTLLDFQYKDHGSLVSLSRHNVVGNLMGRVLGPFFIEGQFAKFSYWSLHKLNQITLFGVWKTFLLTVSNLFTSRIKSGIKLH